MICEMQAWSKVINKKKNLKVKQNSKFQSSEQEI